MTRFAWGAAALLTVSAGCDQPPPTPDAPVGLDAPVLVPDAGRDAGPSLTGFSLSPWDLCPGAPAAGPRECATFTVPIDWDRPSGPSLTRTVRRQVGLGPPEERRGALLWNPGGPGVATFPTTDGITDERLFAAFDSYALDWRGVGNSEPALSCPRPLNVDAYRYQTSPSTTPEGLAESAERLRRVDEACLASIDPVLAEHVGSEDMARDMEALRIAIGEERLSYLGFSYGTSLGAAYAGLYPERVDAFVFDSPVLPNAGWLDWHLAQTYAQEDAIERFLAWCVAADCELARGRSVEALGDVLDAISGELAVRPRFVTNARGVENVIGAETFRGALIGDLSNPRRWPDLGRTLARAEVGDLAPIADEITDFPARRSMGLPLIGHVDVPIDRIWERDEITEFFLSTLLPRAPRASSSFADRIGRAHAVASVRATPLVIHAPDAPPVLFVAGLHDTQTPHVNALAMRELVGRGSHLLTYEGDGHAISGNIPCLREQVVAFLLDPSAAPTVERCAAVVVTP